MVSRVRAEAIRHTAEIFPDLVRMPALGNRAWSVLTWFVRVGAVLDGFDSGGRMAGGRDGGPGPKRQANQHGKRASSDSGYQVHWCFLPALTGAPPMIICPTLRVL